MYLHACSPSICFMFLSMWSTYIFFPTFNFFYYLTPKCYTSCYVSVFIFTSLITKMH